MALRLGALHDALLHPGDHDFARKAAEEVAGYESQIAGSRSYLLLLKCMVGLVIGLLIPIGLKLFGSCNPSPVTLTRDATVTLT